MKNIKKLAIALVVLIAVALVSGLTSLAVTNYGSESDPLVTLSYLNDTFKPAVMEELNKLVSQKSDELTQQFASGQPATPGTSGGTVDSGFSVITLNDGQTVTCKVGAEIMLRIGSAVSNGQDSPRLVDETTGSAVSASGADLEKNHMYMVTIEGNGIKSTAANTKVLIRGEYTVS